MKIVFGYSSCRNAGERKVARILEKLPKESYKIINDVYIATQNRTTQIDHIVASVYGIFVIETKNYCGWIKGDEQSTYWTQNTYRNKYNLYNPIKQNFGHVRALMKILKLDVDKFIPIVVFTTYSDLSVKAVSYVIYSNELKKLILSYRAKKFSKKEVDNIFRIIEKSNNPELKQGHEEYVRSIKFEREKLEQERLEKKTMPGMWLAFSR